MSRSIFISLLALIFLRTHIWGQSDTVVANNFLDSSVYLLDSDLNLSLKYALLSCEIFENNRDTSTLPYVYYLLSSIYHLKGEPQTAFLHAVESHRLSSDYYTDLYPDSHLYISINYHHLKFYLFNTLHDIFKIDSLIHTPLFAQLPNYYKASAFITKGMLSLEFGDFYKGKTMADSCFKYSSLSGNSIGVCEYLKILSQYSIGCYNCLVDQIKNTQSICLENQIPIEHCRILKHLYARAIISSGDTLKGKSLIINNLKEDLDPAVKFNQLLLLAQIFNRLDVNDSTSIYLRWAKSHVLNKFGENTAHMAEYYRHMSILHFEENPEKSEEFIDSALQIFKTISGPSYVRGFFPQNKCIYTKLMLSYLNNDAIIPADIVEYCYSTLLQNILRRDILLYDLHSRLNDQIRIKSEISSFLINQLSMRSFNNDEVYWIAKIIDAIKHREGRYIYKNQELYSFNKYYSLRNKSLLLQPSDSSYLETATELLGMESVNKEKSSRSGYFREDLKNKIMYLQILDTKLDRYVAICLANEWALIDDISPSLLHPDSSHTLYKKIFPENFDWSKYDHLTIVPDGPFHKYSFESMLTDDKPYDHPRDAPYLIKQIPISYSLGLHLARDFSEFDNESVRSVTFAPSFDEKEITSSRDCNEDHYGQLKCNQQEAREVAEILNGEAFLNSSATVANFKQNVDNYNFFHLATHACIDTNNYFESSLIFQDGRLPMSELYETDWNNKTVVLSACNTAKGAHVNGEGIFNFARTLTELGCKEVIVSLWPIDDCGTRDFIKLFYSHIQDGQTTAKALQSARLKYLETADKLHAQPHFWAPLILISNDLHVGQTNDSSHLMWITILGVSLLISSLFLFPFIRN